MQHRNCTAPTAHESRVPFVGNARQRLAQLVLRDLSVKFLQAKQLNRTHKCVKYVNAKNRLCFYRKDNSVEIKPSNACF